MNPQFTLVLTTDENTLRLVGLFIYTLFLMVLAYLIVRKQRS